MTVIQECPQCGHELMSRRIEVRSALQTVWLSDAGQVTDWTGSPASGADEPSTGLYGDADAGVVCVVCEWFAPLAQEPSPALLLKARTLVLPGELAPVIYEALTLAAEHAAEDARIEAATGKYREALGTIEGLI